MSKIGDYYIKDDKDIGRGTFGNVYQAYKDRRPETIYALKKIDLFSLNGKDKQHCYGEVEFMKTLQHPHIVKFHNSFKHEDRYLIIIMEYCQGGSLKHYIQQSQPMSEQECLEITSHISSALKFLHEQKTMHRDVKTDNIFLTADRKAKLGDLGLTRLLDNPTALTQQCGSPLYRSPEIFEGQPYSEKTDIWSLGCCMYEIATKTTPFSGWTEEELRGNVTKQKVKEMTIPYSEELRRLILCMLQKNPGQRPTIIEVSKTVDSLLHKLMHQDDEKGDADNDYLQAATLPMEMQNLTVLPMEMQNLTMSRASMTFPRSSAEMSSVTKRLTPSSNEGEEKERHDITRHHSLPVTSSEDHDYTTCDNKDSVKRHGDNSKHIEHIPVAMTKKEADMRKLSTGLAETLKSYMTESEWNKMSRLLDDHSRNRHLNETSFMDHMEDIVNTDTFGTIQEFLRMYWTMTEPLLTKSFKLAHSDK